MAFPDSANPNTLQLIDLFKKQVSISEETVQRTVKVVRTKKKKSSQSKWTDTNYLEIQTLKLAMTDLNRQIVNSKPVTEEDYLLLTELLKKKAKYEARRSELVLTRKQTSTTNLVELLEALDKSIEMADNVKKII